MELFIKSYSDLGQFAVERNYTRSALECIEVLEVCNEELFKLYITEGFKPGDPPKDATKRDVTGQKRSHGANSGTDMSDKKIENHSSTEEGRNLYDLSANCVRSASLISQMQTNKTMRRSSWECKGNIANAWQTASFREKNVHDYRRQQRRQQNSRKSLKIYSLITSGRLRMQAFLRQIPIWNGVR